MEQSSNLKTSEQIEQTIATLESIDGRRGAKCVLTNENLYMIGPAYFLNYLGNWKKVKDKLSFGLKDITSVSYQRRSNPSKAFGRFLLQLVLSFLFFMIIGTVLSSVYQNGLPFNETSVFLMFILPPLLATIIVILISRRESMLRIVLGCEVIYLKTSWYRKEEIDNLHNQMICLVDENHKNEPASLNSEELFGGEPIISEFGEQYRRQYMKDEQTTGGFCVLSPTQLRMGGLHKVNLVFGIWLPSKGHNSININQINGVHFCDHVKFFKVFLIDLIITSILLGLISLYVFIRPGDYNEGMAAMGYMLSLMFLWGFPGIGGAKMRSARMVVDGALGKYGFDTQWYTKDEVNRFQKTITKVLEQTVEQDKQEQTIKPSIVQQQVPTVNQSIPIQSNTQVSINDGVTLLREYNQLLQEGIIDQAEFDKVKAEIFSKREHN